MQSETIATSDTWLNHIDLSWEEDGKGDSEENPYIIDTAEKLAGLSFQVKNKNFYSNKYFLQTSNISLGGYEWYPIGTHNEEFEGCFNGGNYKITGLLISDATRHWQGLFGAVSGGVIKNVYLKNIKITSMNPVIGGLVGLASYEKIIENCHVSGIIKGYSQKVAGVCGFSWYSKIKDCSFSGSVEAEENLNDENASVGGIVGTHHGQYEIENCVNRGSIKGRDRVGGIVGELIDCNGVLSCINNGNITANRHYGGGIVGNALNSNIEGCHNSGNVSVIDLDGGGIAGQAELTTISKCITSGVIEARSFIGAFVGQFIGSQMTDCKADGLLIAGERETNYRAGLVGRCIVSNETGEDSIIKNCCFVGNSNKTIDAFFSKDPTGQEDVLIENCYTYINRVGYYSEGNFSAWSLVPKLSEMPIQKSLFHVANFGDIVSAVWFVNKGFTKTY